jgi:Cu/Ag efflux protein CusF
MNFEDNSAAMTPDLCAAVPAGASTGETLLQETRGMASQAPVRSVQTQVIDVDTEAQVTTVMGLQGEEIQVPCMCYPNGSPLLRGDAVALEYRNATGVEIEQAAEDDDGTRRRVDSTATLPMGQGYVVAHHAEISATIEHVDEHARQLTLSGVHEQRTVVPPPDFDLTQYKRGDRVHVVFVRQYNLQPAHA